MAPDRAARSYPYLTESKRKDVARNAGRSALFLQGRNRKDVARHTPPPMMTNAYIEAPFPARLGGFGGC